MKKFLKFPILATAVLAISFGMPSCDSDDPDLDTGLNEQITSTIEQYVNNVVVATYKSLADEAINLYDACVALQENTTQENTASACEEWKSARKYWEQSEAFLYGAASDYAIDPHIDSWPLDKAQLDLALQNETLINNMKENGCNFDGFATLGYGLLGFHAIEYMLFRDGGARDINGGTDKDGNAYAVFTEVELIYCVAVAEDLRNQCIRLEAAWAGIESITAEKLEILEEAELEPSLNYGEIMIAAGESGNKIYKTQIAAYAEILQGCADIADEVGNTKITEPVSSGNVLDVESWYSWNSIEDFVDNIRSIQYAYCGVIAEDITSSNTSSIIHNSSVSAYIKSLDETLNNELIAAIIDAQAKISNMPAPFRDNLTEAVTDDAVDACNLLFNKLDEAIELLYN